MPLPKQRTGRANGAAADAELLAATIAVVDDEPTTLMVVEIFLHKAGYENVVTVRDPTQALETIAESGAQLVLLDVVMPGLSGLEILRLMREDARLSSLPVVVFASASDLEVRREALDLGATDFLSKPVDPSELALRVRNTLAYQVYREGFSPNDGAASAEPNGSARGQRIASSGAAET